MAEKGVRLTDRDLPALLKQLKKHAFNWRDIGMHLGFLPGELSNIESRPALFRGAPVSHLGAMLEELIQWAPRDSRGSTDFATIESLKTALCEAGLGAAGHDLSIEPNLSPTPSKRVKVESPVTIEECAEKLSQFYVDLQSMSSTWPPLKLTDFVQLVLVKQDVWAQHIDLTTVTGDIDEVCGKKTRISIKTLFENVNHASLILLEGRPGSGKTTLMLEIASKCKKNIFKHAKLVVLVYLRQLSQTGVISLSQLLETSCVRLSSEDIKCICSFIERECGENVVFLFDGYDEYSYRKSKDSIVNKILAREIFTKSVVVVSSRPAATIEFRQRAIKYVEVVGFLKEQVFEYIKRFFENNEQKVGSLTQHLESHQNLLNICYLPLHCAMLVFLSQEDSCLPKTETEFYRRFTLTWMFRYGHKRSVYPSSLNSFDKLKKEDKQLLDKVCCLAYHATLESKQVFNADEVKDVYDIEIPSQQDLRCGLEMLVIDRIFVLTGMKKTYSFFHLTTQEFLAALYLCTLKDQEKVDAIKRYGSDDHLSVTLRFLCGMMDYSTSATQMVFDAILEATKPNRLLHIQCSYEFQSPLSCTRVFNFHRGFFTLQHLKPSDSTSLAYFLNNAQCCESDITIELHSCLFDVREYEAILQAFGDRCVTLALRFLNYLPLLCAIARVGVPGLVELRFEWCTMGVSDDLKAIYGETLDDDAVANLPIEWTKRCPKLKMIELFQCNVKGDLMKCLKYCSNLESLTVCGCDDPCPLDNSTCQVIGETLQQCSRLLQLNLSMTEMECTGMAAVAKGIAESKGLRKLNLSRTDVGSAGMVHMAESIAGCRELKELDLHDNDLGDDGVKILVETLVVNCKDITDVNLDVNYLTDNSVPYLIGLIKSAGNLDRLVLVQDVTVSDEWNNIFTPRRWEEMEEAVRSRTEDMHKLQIIGRPLALGNDESDEVMII